MAKLKRHNAFTLLSGRPNKSGTTTYECQCVCGSVRWMTAAQMKPLKSCGCLKQKASELKHKYPKEHRAWTRMKRRCHNPNSKDYYGYGSVGVTVAKKWHKFAGFIEDMGPCPEGCNSLDRIKNNKGYEPGNVRWSDAFQQANNKTNNRFFKIGEITRTVPQWSRATGVQIATIWRRLNKGQSIEEAIGENRQKVKVKNLSTGEVFESLKEADTANGLKRGRIAYAVKRGTEAGGHYWALAC